MRLMDHVAINFNKNTSMAAVLLNIDKAFDTTWHPGLLYKFSKLHFSANVIKLFSSFLSNRKLRVTVEGELSSRREIQAKVPQGSVLAHTLYSSYKNDAPRTPGVQLAFLADDTCTRVYSKVSGLAACSENCKWYNYLPLGAVVSLFYESVRRVLPP
jgi:hypothetical protein